MSQAWREQIPGLLLPYSQEPKVFKTTERFAKAQNRYLYACQTLVTDPGESVGYLWHRTNILLRNFRSVTRAILDMPDAEVEESHHELQTFILEGDAERVTFLRDLTEYDGFPYTFEMAGPMRHWMETKYMMSASNREFEDEMVRMVSIIINDNNHTLAEALGFQIESV